jgi:hypothetical protein
MSEKRSMRALEADATVEMSFVVRTAVGGDWPWLDAIRPGEKHLVVFDSYSVLVVSAAISVNY